jgi:ABC-type dipeptide/oligopeptide/nickel transport system permease subunit
VWGLLWGLVWVLVIAFAKALASTVSNMASCHDLGVLNDIFVKDLNASVSNMASFPGLFLWYVLMAVIGIMCQSYMLCFFIAYE